MKIDYSKVIRQDGALRIVRTALGQVVDYDVYDGEQYKGGGSKREAYRLYEKLLKAKTEPPVDDVDQAYLQARENGWAD